MSQKTDNTALVSPLHIGSTLVSLLSKVPTALARPK
jgi:hypothetical protein